MRKWLFSLAAVILGSVGVSADSAVPPQPTINIPFVYSDEPLQINVSYEMQTQMDMACRAVNPDSVFERASLITVVSGGTASVSIVCDYAKSPAAK